MPDENGFATPEERGDFVPDSDNPPPETTDAAAASEPANTDGGDGGGDSDSAGEDGGTGETGVTATGEADDNADAAGAADAAASDPAATDADTAAATEGDAPADDAAAAVEVEAAPDATDTKDAAPTEKPAEAETRARPRIQRVPKNRFDTKVKQLAEARERIVQLEAEAAKNATDQTSTIQALNTQLLEKNQAVAAAVKDGTGDIAALMLEAQTTQQLITDARIAEATQYTATEVDEKSEFRRTLDDVESIISALQPGHADYDQDQVDRVSELTQTFQKAGQSAAEAVLRSVSLLYPDEADAPPPATKPSPGKPGAAKKTDVAKNVAAAKKQPPPLADMGDDSNKLGAGKVIDVTKLTEKEFDALPLETIKRLRGDAFTG